MESRIQELKDHYKLEKHPEGGWFNECYSSSASLSERAFAGSIYFLLEKDEISHFHQIDCEEIWYYHEGCGMNITVITDDGQKELLLGSDITIGEEVMVAIPKGAIFAAENLDSNSYTFVSCMTTPKFSYNGFKLIGKKELRALYPGVSDDTLRLAYD
ncbi:cupin domain-containing protein [Butyrivibrio sp. MC2021]|uniref:cupin domain-containing protein n=1 Tax=Butyrivibrio sp. MC2021 TaxID=1408306 RepID=UPI00047E6017|nr:cupin domain-containing protein [Butyrivibrio sp. MC2021]